MPFAFWCCVLFAFKTFFGFLLPLECSCLGIFARKIFLDTVMDLELHHCLQGFLKELSLVRLASFVTDAGTHKCKKKSARKTRTTIRNAKSAALPGCLVDVLVLYCLILKLFVV